MHSRYQKILIFLFDVSAATFSWIFSFLLRYNFSIPQEDYIGLISTIPSALLVNLFIFYFYRTYRPTWQYISLENIRDLFFAIISSLLIVILFVFLFRHPIPRSVLIIYPSISIIILGGARTLYRYSKEYNLKKTKSSSLERVVIYGAGSAGENLARSLKKSHKWKIIAFLDDDQTKQNRELQGVAVIGGLSKIKNLKEKYHSNKLVIAIPSISLSQKKAILNEAAKYNIDILSVPSIDDLILGRIGISEIKPILIEDILGREEVRIDDVELKNLILNRVILISGAGGSIGSELCRQVLRYNPKSLICVDISETSLYLIEQELLELKANSKFVVADVKNQERITQIFNQFKPEIVFHAAAYKHVPLMEYLNVSEVLINNVVGTYNLAKISQLHKVKKFILISTDKAVNPTNVMGASKYLAEKVCRGLNKNSNTKFIITRFGNVLGSSGSVIPKFREQIKSGGPVTVTHPKITRYFMSIPEAAQLVMQACVLAKGGEIFVLDMGEPIKITDLAKQMIKLSGLKSNDIKIQFSGLRPGEKLYEELFSYNESSRPTVHPKIKVAFSRPITDQSLKDLVNWASNTIHKEEQQIKKELEKRVKGYIYKN
jgi:FlaA1/EpsC-like NDP-sugar epimerase